MKLLQVILIILWAGIILICVIHFRGLSPEDILRYTPENLWLSALVMLLLFALKSVSIVIYSGILYAACGLIFPLPIAFLVNLCGTVIMLSLPYGIGKKAGNSAVNDIREKYPKVQEVQSLRAQNDLFFAFLVRICRLPSDISSLYMGAVNVDYKKYLLGSLLGMLPHMITYPIMGMSVSDIHSPEFLISLCAEILYVILTTVLYGLYHRKHQNGETDQDK